MMAMAMAVCHAEWTNWKLDSSSRTRKQKRPPAKTAMPGKRKQHVYLNPG